METSRSRTHTALAFVASAAIATTLTVIAVGIHRMYGGVDPMFLMASGALTVLPLLIRENW